MCVLCFFSFVVIPNLDNIEAYFSLHNAYKCVWVYSNMCSKRWDSQYCEWREKEWKIKEARILEWVARIVWMTNVNINNEFFLRLVIATEMTQYVRGKQKTESSRIDWILTNKTFAHRCIHGLFILCALGIWNLVINTQKMLF